MNIFKRKNNKDKKPDSKEIIKYPDHIKNLDKTNFNDFISQYPLSLIEFWAPWCAPCKAMIPRIRRLSVIYKGKIAFGKIDISKNQEISKKYDILSIPQIIFFKYGSKLTYITGAKSISKLKEIIENLLKNNPT